MNFYFEPVNIKHWNIFEKVKNIGHIETFVATQTMKCGDKVLLYVGKQDKSRECGIYAIGDIIKEPYISQGHPQAYYNNKKSVDIKIIKIQYTDPIINGEECKKIIKQFRTVHEITGEQRKLLSDMLSDDYQVYPDEMATDGIQYNEGSVKKVFVNAYERNEEARKKCIEYYGAKCSICGFDFGKVYGAEFAEKIHVHHIKPLNEIKENYIVNPITDLIPVCPNCHMILHYKKGGTYTPEEVKQFIQKNK